MITFTFRTAEITTNDVVDRREAANATYILKQLLNENVYDIRTRPFAQSESAKVSRNTAVRISILYCTLSV